MYILNSLVVLIPRYLATFISDNQELQLQSLETVADIFCRYLPRTPNRAWRVRDVCCRNHHT